MLTKNIVACTTPGNYKCENYYQRRFHFFKETFARNAKPHVEYENKKTRRCYIYDSRCLTDTPAVDL